MQDISGPHHVPTVTQFEVWDCRAGDGDRCVAIRSGFGEYQLSGVGDDFASVLAAVIECAKSAAPDPWDFGFPASGYTTPSP